MAEDFPWLPLNTDLGASLSVGRLLQDGTGYQLILSRNGDKVILLLREQELPKVAVELIQKLVESGLVKDFLFGDETFRFAVFERKEAPKKISSLIGSAGNSTTVPLRPLAFALADLRTVAPSAVWGEGIYVQSEKICIPTVVSERTEPEPDRYKLLVSLLVGATTDVSISIETIKKLNPELETTEIREFLTIAGFEDAHLLSKFGHQAISPPETFSLAGRPELQEFFREYVIDFYFRYDQYKSMGFNAPNGILLFGPPGSGKTFAVKKLSEFLRWPVYDVDIGAIGSPYIHETSRKLKQVFEEAANNAPSIVLLEEIDALAANRNAGVHESKIEEVAQLLRLLESAANNGVLVIATTNRYEALDSAIVRRGRFDHVIEVGLPNKEEIILALTSLLNTRPTSKNIDIDSVASKLAGRPMSDVAWLVNEAARIAVRRSKSEIETDALVQACERLEQSVRKSY